MFAQILNYYRTGKLHYPTDVCGPLFEVRKNGKKRKRMSCFKIIAQKLDFNDERAIVSVKAF